MYLTALIEKKQIDKQKLASILDFLESIDRCSASRVEDFKSCREWLTIHLNQLQDELNRLKNLEDIINRRVGFLKYSFFVLVCINLLLLLWEPSFGGMIISGIILLCVFLLGICCVNPALLWGPVFIAVTLPLIFFYLFSLIPGFSRWIENYSSAITFLSLIYALVFAAFGNRIASHLE